MPNQKIKQEIQKYVDDIIRHAETLVPKELSGEERKREVANTICEIHINNLKERKKYEREERRKRVAQL